MPILASGDIRMILGLRDAVPMSGPISERPGPKYLAVAASFNVTKRIGDIGQWLAPFWPEVMQQGDFGG
jgi:hypothetical protein